MTATTAGIVPATLLPFLPGGYDSLAAPLSAMTRIFGIVGLLLVPVGALWVAAGYWSGLAEHTRGHYAVHDGPEPHWKYFWFD